jgi:hypothetical protein
MKTIVACLFGTALSLNAQSTVDGFLSQALKQSAALLQAIPEADQKVVIAETSALLQKHVTFRPDGTSTAFSTISDPRQSLEWKNLVIKTIAADALTDADKLNGFEKRYRAILSSEATRKWDPKSKAWTQWSPGGHTLFPTGITVEWKNGIVSTSGGSYLPKFSPGPGPSIQDAKAPKSSTTLPPGVTPAK